MPISRKTLQANRVKIVDDPNNPGNPLRVDPIVFVRSRAEIEALQRAAAEFVAANKTRVLRTIEEFAEMAVATAVFGVIDWLTDPQAPRPTWGEKP